MNRDTREFNAKHILDTCSRFARKLRETEQDADVAIFASYATSESPHIAVVVPEDPDPQNIGSIAGAALAVYADALSKAEDEQTRNKIIGAFASACFMQTPKDALQDLLTTCSSICTFMLGPDWEACQEHDE